MPYLLAIIIVSIILAIIFHKIGSKQTFDNIAGKRGYIHTSELDIIKQKVETMRQAYESNFESAKSKMMDQVKDLETMHDKEVISETEKQFEGNPFGSYLIPCLKISSLYNVRDKVQKGFDDGKMHYKSYEAKMNWLDKTIAERIGTSYDDTKLNIGFDETE